MEPSSEIAVYNAEGQLVLVVETKSKLGTSSEWAAKMRRNILAHGLLPKTQFFLLALPDRFYLWKDVNNTPEIVEPTYQIDPRLLLQPYYEKSGISLEQLSSTSFELIIVAWLSEILQSDTLLLTMHPNQEWFVESGLLKAIKGGRIAIPVAI